jgi:hypothetical protein
MSCAKYADMFRANPEEADERSLAWALAYISRVNSRSFDLKAMTPDAMKCYLRHYCIAYPFADYSDAVEALMRWLPSVNGEPATRR